MVQPKVSMVIPCYNKAGYLGDMLNSVLEQTWDRLEVILVNDGSTDRTMEIIKQYEPILMDRGWAVILVDQQNQGVAAAVRSGLIRVTGDYVCFPDGDDVLHPEYVSVLAGTLDRFPEVSCVVCDEVRNRWLHGFAPQEKATGALYPSSQEMIPKFILGKMLPGVWVMMIRTFLIEELNMIEHFFTNICATQEPQIWLPVLAADKSIYHIERPLYTNVARAESIVTSQTTAERIYRFAEARRNLIQAVLEANITSNAKLDYYSRLSDIGRFDLIARRLNRVSGTERFKEENRRDFVTAVSHSGLLPEPLDANTVDSVGFRIAYHAVSNYLIGYVPEGNRILDIIAGTPGRLIMYGAGMVAAQILPDVLQCGITPDLVWDAKALEGDLFLELPLTAPDFSSLTKDDTVVLFLNGHRDVEYMLKEYDARVIYYQDVLDALAVLHFPELAVVKHD